MQVKYPFTYVCFILFLSVLARAFIWNSDASLEIKVFAVVVAVAFTLFAGSCEILLDELDEKIGRRF